MAVARKLLAEDGIRKSYVDSLFEAQLFEFLLDTLYSLIVKKGLTYFSSIGLSYDPGDRNNWTINEYLKRLQTFFPRNENIEIYNQLENAMHKRNDFIHQCFKVDIKGHRSINLEENMYLDGNAIKRMKEWNMAFKSGTKAIFVLMKRIQI